jgi:hypothetical protein
MRTPILILFGLATRLGLVAHGHIGLSGRASKSRGLLGGVASAAAVALVCTPAATAAGPWLGTASNGVAEYTANVHGTTTVVGDGSQTLRLDGKWGLPRVTLNNGVGGLSADGRTLVLSQDFNPTGSLERESTFLVLGTKPLRVRTTVQLKGDFGFDALSPTGRTIYLIQHVSAENLFRYRVRAYDVVAGSLVKRVIADKRQRDWNMSGYPVARAASANGHWVYTLYSNPDNYPFVHALDTVGRTAVCIGIPWDWTADQQAIDQSTLRIVGNKLMIGDRFVLDRSTFKVVEN